MIWALLVVYELSMAYTSYLVAATNKFQISGLADPRVCLCFLSLVVSETAVDPADPAFKVPLGIKNNPSVSRPSH